MNVAKRSLLVILLSAAVATMAWAQNAVDITADFEAVPLGPATPACDPALTGGGGPVDWQIVEDPMAPAGPHVLAEVSRDTTSSRFPICILRDFSAANVEVSVAFKPVAGAIDQAAGVMVRIVDANNYYIARANALEGNVRFYKVENGVRDQLATANVPVVVGQWSTLGLRIVGDRAEVLLDGVVLFGATDQTFPAAGGVGVWTKADSLTYFDLLTATALP
ncbi:MAG: hypothetical protein ACWA6X_01520 [Bauldia sp.]